MTDTAHTRAAAARPGERGFTLVELLVVIVVLGILAGITLFGVARFRSDANAAACKADLATISVAADAYDAQTGNYPATVAVLVTGGYLKSTPSGSYALDTRTKTVTRTPACADGTDTAGGTGTAAPTGTPTGTGTPTATGTGTPSATASAARTGSITGLGGGCLDLANDSGKDGTAVQLSTCASGNPGQRWTVPASYPGAFGVLDGCLAVKDGKGGNNTAVELGRCDGTGAQLWTLQANGTLVNPLSGRCLTVDANHPTRSQLFVFDCGAGDNQIFVLPAR